MYLTDSEKANAAPIAVDFVSGETGVILTSNAVTGYICVALLLTGYNYVMKSNEVIKFTTWSSTKDTLCSQSPMYGASFSDTRG